MTKPKTSPWVPDTSTGWILLSIMIIMLISSRIWKDDWRLDVVFLLSLIGFTWYAAYRPYQTENVRDLRIYMPVLLFTLIGFAAFLYLISYLWERRII